MDISNFNHPVAENIARIIKCKDLKQVQVAKKAGYSRQQLNDMLNGRKLIKVSDILQIARALDVGCEKLFEVRE